MNIRPKSGRSHRGAVLILVLVMLALLAMLAISLATTSALDRNTSHNYIDEVRARLVAKAGIEHAISRIQSMMQRGKFEDPSMTYWGHKVNEDGEPDIITPLVEAQNPSFAIEDENPQNPDDDKTRPVQFKLEDRDVGISGMLSSSTYGVHSDVYRLRVDDCNSKINVNDGLDDPSVAKNLQRILNHLGAACKVKEAGDRLISKRPRIGYRTRKEVRSILGEEDFKKIGNHITTYAWRDKDLVNPVPLSQSVLGAYPVDYNQKISLYRYGRSRTATGEIIDRMLAFAPDYSLHPSFDHAVMAMDEVNAQWIGLSSRSPVNVNGASVEVLTALIADLRGIFMVERRKKNPGGGQYTFMFYPRHTNLPGGDPIGAELGFLYATPKFMGPGEEGQGGTSAAGSVTASVIANEMVACRQGQKSKIGEYNYGSQWFGGPFRTWRQFNAFCDSLVERGILADTRNIYVDYVPADATSSGSWSSGDCGVNDLIPSTCQPKVAAQAMADVLKANFNPNCTLNELNPDRNMFLEVDKTDLICNSTEFCFTPMGYFEIECEGLIVKTPRGDDLMRARMGVIQARENIECVVKVFDVFKQATQMDFKSGDLGLRVRRLMTNSNKPLELGPEPDAGENPDECRWSGWIQLSTIGGIRRPEGDHVVMSTPKATNKEFDSVAYGHFQFDHRLNYHASDQQHPLQFSGGFGNQPDRTEAHAGPYNPSRGGRGEYRLARNWTLGSVPSDPVYKAVSDLRIDGAYIERDGALLYPCTPDVFATEGTIAFWLKPAFRPEMTGKPRTFFSTDTFISGQGGSLQAEGWQLINGLWFFASHDHAPYSASSAEFAIPSYWLGPWRPVSFCGGYATKGSYGGGVGHQTPSLNHSLHAHSGSSLPPVGNMGDQWVPGKFTYQPRDPLEHHRWMHVGYNWDMGGQNVQIMINGVTYSGPEVFVHPQPTSADDWTQVDAIFRIGEPSATMSYGGSRNWTIDGTIDEFFMWKGNKLSTVTQIFDRGRYHIPRFGQEGIFTSGAILPDNVHGQKFPEPSTARPPVSTSSSAARGDGRTRTMAPTQDNRSSDVMKPICAFWTWYAEGVDQDGKPVMFDFMDPQNPLKVEVSMQMLIDGAEVGEVMTLDGGSPIDKVSVKKDERLQYRLKILLPDAVGASMLLCTPIIDDVTILYTKGVEYIHYNRVDHE